MARRCCVSMSTTPRQTRPQLHRPRSISPIDRRWQQIGHVTGARARSPFDSESHPRGGPWDRGDGSGSGLSADGRDPSEGRRRGGFLRGQVQVLLTRCAPGRAPPCQPDVGTWGSRRGTRYVGWRHLPAPEVEGEPKISQFLSFLAQRLLNSEPTVCVRLGDPVYKGDGRYRLAWKAFDKKRPLRGRIGGTRTRPRTEATGGARGTGARWRRSSRSSTPGV